MLVKVPKIRAGQRRTAERPATLDTFAGVIPQAAARATTVAVGEWTVNQSMVIGLQTEKPCLDVSSVKRPTGLTAKDLAARAAV